MPYLLTFNKFYLALNNLVIYLKSHADLSIGFVLGIVGGIAVNIIYDRFLKSPNLEIETGSKTPPNPLPRSQNVKYSFLHINVTNKDRLGITNPALSVKAKITFREYQNQSELFFVDGRWSGNPEPLIPMDPFATNCMANPMTYPVLRKIDILPGDTQELDVAIKYDDEQAIYAFSNESYELADNMWRKTEWRIDEKEICVEVIVYSGSLRKKGLFLLKNPGANLEEVSLIPYPS